jgi:hypothetical protein
MLHPAWTAELARQRRATVNAKASHERLMRQTRSPPHADPDSDRLVATAQTLAHHLRALKCFLRVVACHG